MALSPSDINIVDEKNKQHHAETTGYDYSSEIQTIIHSYVELRSSFPSQPNPLTPPTGDWEYNGQKVNISQADIDAYCAAHPQVCVSPANRDSAVEILKGGGTFAPNPPPSSENGDSPTPSAPAEQSADETAEAATLEEDSDTSYETTPTFPPMPNTASHKVNVKSWLALRSEPSTVKTNDNAFKDTELKGTLLEKMPNGTELIVIDEGTGYNCEWYEVLVPGKKYKVEGKKKKVHRLYCSSKFVKKITSKKSAPMSCSKQSNSLAPFKDWTTQTPNEPYFDEKDAKHKVAVEMVQYDSTGGAELTSRMEEAYYQGLSYILKENGKQSDSEYVTSLLEQDYYLFAHAEDYHVSTKQGVPLKVLVTVSDKYLQELAPAPDVEEVKPGVFTAGEGALENVKFRSLYSTNTLESKLDQAATCLEGIAEEIKTFEGTVVDYDANTEAERLRKMKNNFSVLFSDNGITHDPFTKDETLVVGWDETLTPIYVNLTMEDGSSATMAKSMTKFQDTPPVDSQRTQGYMWLLDDMNTHCSNLTWTEFVTTFTLPTPPEIKPGGDDDVGDVTEDEDLAEKESKSMDDKPAKTQTQKEKEDQRLFDLELKKMLWLDRKDKRNFVGDAIASPDGLQAAIDKIETVDDAFNVVLNKISVVDLIQIAMSCIVVDFNLELDIDVNLDLFTDINSLLTNPEDLFDLSAMGAGALALPKIPTIDLPDELPVTDIMASMANAIKDALMELLKALFVLMIKAVLQALIDICQGSNSDSPSPESNLNDMLEDSTPDTPNRPAAAQDLLGDLMDALGIGSDDPTSTVPPTREQVADMQNMLDDVSLILTPFEICTLINGTASLSTLNIVRSLILRSYPNFNFKSRTKLSDFFRALGKMIDPRICIGLLNQPTSEGPLGDVLCNTSEDLNKLRKGLLSNKGDGITPDQIDEILDKAQKRRADMADALADMLTQGALSDDYEPPPIFCTKGGEKQAPGPGGAPSPSSEAPKKKGLIDLSHDSIDFFTEKVVDTLWAPTYMAFSRDAKDWHKAVVVKTSVKTEVPTKVGDGDGITNPYLEAKLGKTMADEVAAGDSDTYELDAEVNRTAPQLREAYENFETNKALEFIAIGNSPLDPHRFLFDSIDDEHYSTGYALKLALPEDSTLSQAFANFEDFDTDEFDLGTHPTELGEDGLPRAISIADLTSLAKSAIPKWNLYYVLPAPGTVESSITVHYDVVRMWMPDVVDRISAEPVTIPLSQFEEIAETNPDVPYEAGDDILAFVEQEMAALIQGTTITNLEFPVGTPTQFAVEQPFVITSAEMIDGNPHDDYFIFVTKEQEGEEEVAFHLKGEGKYDLSSLAEDQPGVSMDISGFSFLNPNTSPQQAILAQRMLNIWRDVVEETDETTEVYSQLRNSIESPVTDTYIGDVKTETSTSLFGEMTRDIMAYIARRAALSPFFGEISSHTAGAGDDVGSPTSTVISMINLAADLAPECIVNGTDPHLLNISDMKKKAKCDIKDNACIDLDAPTDGSPDSKRSEMENAIMKTVVRTTIRAYIIDHYLRGIFVNSVFGEADEVDDTVLEYFAGEIKAGLYEYDDLPAPFPKGTYRDEFLEALVDLYESEKEDAAGEGQDYDSEPSAEDDGEHFHDESAPVDEALKHYIKLEYPDVAQKLKQIFNVSKPDADKDIHSVFLEEYLPLFQLPLHTDEMRFAESSIKGFSHDSGDMLYESELAGLGFRTEVETEEGTTISQIVDIDIVTLEDGSGAFGTSSYEEQDSDVGYDFSVNYGSDSLSLQDFINFNQITTTNQQRGLDASPGFFANKLNEPFDSTNGQFYVEKYVRVVDHPREVWDEIVKKSPESTVTAESWFRNERGHLDSLEAKSLIHQNYENWRFHGVMDAGVFAEMCFKMVQADGNEEDMITKFNSMPLQGPDGIFAEVKWGFRIMYLPPTDTSSFIVARADSDPTHWIDAINNRRQENPKWPVDLKDITSKATVEAEKKIIKEKAFRILERFEGASMESIQGNTNETDRVHLVHLVREVNPFPVASTEWLPDPSSSRESTFLGTLSSFREYWGVDTPNWSSNTKAIDNLRADDEYKLLTDYIFPLERYKMLMCMYGTQAISTTGNVAIAFSETKDELYRLFHAVNAKGDYKQHDKALEKIGGNEGLAQTVNNHFGGIQDIPCLDFNLGFDFSFGLKGLGLSFILKMVIEAALIIFKKWVERFDLNISLAFALSFLSKLVCLNIPTTAFSFGLLPMNVFIGLPGIPISIQGFVYHALGMGLWKSVGDDNSDLKKQLKDLGFEPASLPCPVPTDDCGDPQLAISGAVMTQVMGGFQMTTPVTATGTMTYDIPTAPLVSSTGYIIEDT